GEGVCPRRDAGHRERAGRLDRSEQGVLVWEVHDGAGGGDGDASTVADGAGEGGGGTRWHDGIDAGEPVSGGDGASGGGGGVGGLGRAIDELDRVRAGVVDAEVVGAVGGSLGEVAERSGGGCLDADPGERGVGRVGDGPTDAGRSDESYVDA